MTWKTFVSTKQPTVTEEPVVTPTPKVTQEPSATNTQAPVVTQEPAATNTPVPTDNYGMVLNVSQSADVNKVAIKSVKAASKKKIKVSWNKTKCVMRLTVITYPDYTHTTVRAEDVSGYKIQYSTKKNFKSAKTKNVSVKKTSITLTNLKKGKTYYVRVRAYKNVNGKAKYGAWSTVKKCKVK